jgi:hypothetical protein
MLIKNDSLDVNVLNRDLYITSGHRVLVDGKSIKAKHVKGAQRVKVKFQNIYSILALINICTKCVYLLMVLMITK